MHPSGTHRRLHFLLTRATILFKLLFASNSLSLPENLNRRGNGNCVGQQAGEDGGARRGGGRLCISWASCWYLLNRAPAGTGVTGWVQKQSQIRLTWK